MPGPRATRRSSPGEPRGRLDRTRVAARRAKLSLGRGPVGFALREIVTTIVRDQIVRARVTRLSLRKSLGSGQLRLPGRFETLLAWHQIPPWAGSKQAVRHRHRPIRFLATTSISPRRRARDRARDRGVRRPRAIRCWSRVSRSVARHTTKNPRIVPRAGTHTGLRVIGARVRDRCPDHALVPELAQRRRQLALALRGIELDRPPGPACSGARSDSSWLSPRRRGASSARLGTRKPCGRTSCVVSWLRGSASRARRGLRRRRCDRRRAAPR